MEKGHFSDEGAHFEDWLGPPRGRNGPSESSARVGGCRSCPQRRTSVRMGRTPDLLCDEDFPVTYGRYTLLGVLGEGGMARVFHAELKGPSGFRKPAAVKIIRSNIADGNDQLRDSLINEARLGGLLQHSNIVETYDFGEMGGLPFIAMELVRGIELGRLLRLASPLAGRQVLDIGIQMCAGLDAAHELENAEVKTELVHRDLKPSNVIVGRDGTVKILDFGIAKAAEISSNLTSPGMTKGTPAYMSPEQLEGEALDRRSDLFALGLVLYELAAGRPFFAPGAPLAVIMAVAQVEERLGTEDFAEVETVVPGLGVVLRRCLREDPAERFETAAQVEAALEQLRDGLPTATSLRHLVRMLMEEHGIAVGVQSAQGVAALTPRLPMASERGLAEPGPTRAFLAASTAPPGPDLHDLAVPQSVPGAPAPWLTPPEEPGPTRAFPAGAVSAQRSPEPTQTRPRRPRPRGPDVENTDERRPPRAPAGTLWQEPKARRRPKRSGPLLSVLIGAVFLLLFALVWSIGQLPPPPEGSPGDPTSDPRLVEPGATSAPTDTATAEDKPDRTDSPTTRRPQVPAGRTEQVGGGGAKTTTDPAPGGAVADAPEPSAERGGDTERHEGLATGAGSDEPQDQLSGRDLTNSGREPEDQPPGDVAGEVTGEPADQLSGDATTEATEEREQPPLGETGDASLSTGPERDDGSPPPETEGGASPDSEDSAATTEPLQEQEPESSASQPKVVSGPARPESTPAPPRSTPAPPRSTPAPRPTVPKPEIGRLRAEVLGQTRTAIDVLFQIRARGSTGLRAQLRYRFETENKWHTRDMSPVGKDTFQLGRAFPRNKESGKVKAYVLVFYGDDGRSIKSGELRFSPAP